MEVWMREKKKFLRERRSDLSKIFLKKFKKSLDFFSGLLYSKFLNLLKALIRRQLANMELIGINEGVSLVCVNQQVCHIKYESKTMYAEGYRLSGAYTQAGGKHEIKNKMESAVPGSVI